MSSATVNVDPLSYGSNNQTVTSFQNIVNNTLGVRTDVSVTVDPNDPLPVKVSTNLTQDIYDKAANLPDAKTVSLKLLETATNNKYGKFRGGNTYKDFFGTIDKVVDGQSGWVVFDNSITDYCLFTNNGNTYIIAVQDFEPNPIIETFTPLYDALREKMYDSVSSLFEDTHTTSSLSTTFKEDVAEAIQDNPDQVIENAAEAITTPDEFKDSLSSGEPLTEVPPNEEVKSPSENPKYNWKGVYPKQFNVKSNISGNLGNTDALNSVQAVIKDVPSKSSSHVNILYCYQQPDSISYTASSQYDAVSPRGSQQPFQFYNCANQIELSFTLRWHADEVRTFSPAMSLQQVAGIAEDFTRPWISNYNDNTNSVTPKVVQVILPGISATGYLTSAQITYQGDMTGDFNSTGGVIDTSATSSTQSYRSQTSYHYNQLEIAFNLIVIKDINLLEETNAANIINLEGESYYPNSSTGGSSSSGRTVGGRITDMVKKLLKGTVEKTKEVSQSNTEEKPDNDEVEGRVIQDGIDMVCYDQNQTPKYEVTSVYEI